MGAHPLHDVARGISSVDDTVDAPGDHTVDACVITGDNATTSPTAKLVVAADCGTWGRARDEQNGADLR